MARLFFAVNFKPDTLHEAQSHDNSWMHLFLHLMGFVELVIVDVCYTSQRSILVCGKMMHFVALFGLFSLLPIEDRYRHLPKLPFIRHIHMDDNHHR